MISSYRLGDLVEFGLEPYEREELLAQHPNSIGSQYLIEKKTSDKSNLDIITSIVLQYLDQNLDQIPDDIGECTVIHLRMGDVIGGNAYHEIAKRPLTIEHLQEILKDEPQKRYVIGKCFFARPSSRNYEECVNLSNKYLNDVLHTLNASHFDSGNPDIDLCCAICSKLFVQGKGYYSKLIVDIRKQLNLRSIETIVHETLHPF